MHGTQIGHRILRKRIHVRIEHVAPSRCREEFLVRQKKNDQIKHEAKERGGRAPCCQRHVKAGAACFQSEATGILRKEAFVVEETRLALRKEFTVAEANSLARAQALVHQLAWESCWLLQLHAEVP